MKKYIMLFTVFFLVAFSKDKPAYKLYNNEGKEIFYKKMLQKLEKADIVFFGELHDNPIAHWLEYEIANDLYLTKKGNLILAAEMFDSDNQLLIEEYLNGLISEKKFEDEARLWTNYKTDYKALIKLAKDKSLTFIASNLPRRYASIVANKGFEGLEELSDKAKEYIAPLPIIYDPEVKCYKDMMNMQHGIGTMNKPNENFPKAQAIKDATMAHFILQNWSEGKLIIHYNGNYHSDNYEGIIWYIKQYNKEINIMSISTILNDNIDKPDDESFNRADFILVVPENMTRTYATALM